MILESAQLLCSAHHVLDNCKNKKLYKLTHKNNSCSLWVRKSSNNYKWLCELGLALCFEYTLRYDKIHKTQKLLEWLSKNIPKNIKSGKRTKFVLCMPEKYHSSNAVESYRELYRTDKRYLAIWKNNLIPDWFY